MKLTIESHSEHLKQVVEFEGNVEEYHRAFGEDVDPYKVKQAISKTLSKMYKQMNGNINLSAYREEKDNED